MIFLEHARIEKNVLLNAKGYLYNILAGNIHLQVVLAKCL